MFCPECGSKLNQEARFCSNCGEAVNEKMRHAKSKQLRCQNCDGVMNVEEDKAVLLCPYCGSKELLIENDNVKIAKIHSQARKDIELGKQQTDRDIELSRQQVSRDIELGKQQKDFEILKQKHEMQELKTVSVVGICMFVLVAALMIVLLLLGYWD